MSVSRRYLVTGLQGQVAQSLLNRSPPSSKLEVIAYGRPCFDLTQPETIEEAIDCVEPDLVISAAAYTAVDRAETDELAARTINADGPSLIATLAARHRIPMIHLSTDYVFDGTKTGPYNEGDPVAPLGAYGRTKLEGERRVQEAYDNTVILRTAWVYSPFGKNFVKTMLQLAATRDSLNVVDDQIGNPTSALDLADGILAVAENLLKSADPALRGIFHMTSAGETSRADFADAIFRVSLENGGPAADVNRISTSEYPTPAKRPLNSRLDCQKLRSVHGVSLPDWHQSTTQIVKNLLK